MGQADSLLSEYFDLSIWEAPINSNYSLYLWREEGTNPPRDAVVLDGRYIVDYMPQGLDTVDLTWGEKPIVHVDTFKQDEVRQEAFFQNDVPIALRRNWHTRDSEGHFRTWTIRQGRHVATYYENGILCAIYECTNAIEFRDVTSVSGNYEIWNVLLYNDPSGNPVSHGTLKEGSCSFKAYRLDGSLEYIMEFKGGKPHGRTTIYRSDGTVSVVMLHDNGRRLKTYNYDDSGRTVVKVISK